MPRSTPHGISTEHANTEDRHKELLLAIVTAGLLPLADPEWAVAQARKAVALIQGEP